MLRALVAATLLFGLMPGRALCQEAAAPAAAPTETALVSIQGEVDAADGGRLPGVNVWAATLAAPARHLAETKTTATGEFTLSISLPGGLQGGETLLVAADLPAYVEACELVAPAEIPSSSPLRLWLRAADDNYDNPDLDLVDAWLYRRLKRLVKAQRLPEDTRRSVNMALRLSRKRPSTRDSLLEVLRLLGPAENPPARLLQAQTLMRLGAWRAAGKSLAPREPQDKALPEGLLLEGVRHNILHEPAQAIPSLERASQDLPGDVLVSLELGRAYLIAENWTAVVRSLEPALRKRALVLQARYLRARALVSMGDLEGASYEAKMFLKPRRKNVPLSVHSFMAEVLGRLEERSIHPIDSALTQSVGELQKAVPDLAGLNPSGAPPPGGFPELLRQVGVRVEEFMKEFANTAALEVIRQARLDRTGKPAASRAQEFYYIFMNKEWKGLPWIEEFRGTGEGALTTQGGTETGYMATSGFASSLVVFHPELQPGMGFRFLGRQSLGGRPTYVIAFAQRPDKSRPLGSFRMGKGAKPYAFFLQGIAWISADQHQVLRMRTDLLHPLTDIQLTRETTEIDYQQYHFAAAPQAFCLPTRVTVSLEWGKRRLRNEHLFSRFWLFKVDTEHQRLGEAGIVERAKAAQTN
ncbi:MAG: carboxypeptidase-like regulatory domain-containing protein [Acidobacteriia bacterium]|nr:carboxypeptidase-like regulatory domain-containing protein [Terriglobia bacterium]